MERDLDVQGSAEFGGMPESGRNLAAEQMDHSIMMARAQLALEVYKAQMAAITTVRVEKWDKLIAIYTAELRATLLPALGLPTD